MNKKDFQNGYALGMASGGVVEVKDKEAEELFMCITQANQLFHSAKSFPTKAVVNLPNATNVFQAFAYWNTEPIPIVEELTVTAPNIDVTNAQYCMGQMFMNNRGVKKVTLNMSDESKYTNSTFTNASMLEEIVLNFSKKNIIQYNSTFSGCSALKKIVGVLDFSSATNTTNTFLNCSALQEITFAKETLSISLSLAQSSKLTAESVQSIIDGLATVETAQTLTLNKAIALTDEQKDTIKNKGWTLVQ